MSEIKEIDQKKIKSIKINLIGKNYILKIHSDEEEQYYIKLANYVEETMKNIKQRAKVEDFQHLLLLACLSLADEILNSPNSNFNYINEVNQKDKLFNQKLNQVLFRIKHYLK